MCKLFLNIRQDDINTLFSKIDSDKDGFIRYGKSNYIHQFFFLV